MRISDWSSDVCSSDLPHPALTRPGETPESPAHLRDNPAMDTQAHDGDALVVAGKTYRSRLLTGTGKFKDLDETGAATEAAGSEIVRSEEHTSELQSLMRISYAVFCLKKKNLKTSTYTQ